MGIDLCRTDNSDHCFFMGVGNNLMQHLELWILLGLLCLLAIDGLLLKFFPIM